jgi:uncharacterized protein YecT (DUF1311 family)
VTRQLHRITVSKGARIGTLSARSDGDAITAGEHMKMLYQLPTAVCLAFLAGGVGCSKSNENPEVADVSQDTMLLRDLAEANKNTAAASAVDNSLTTIRTTGGGSLPENDAARLSGGGAGSQALTSGPRLTPPLKATDASGPTTVPTQLSPASRRSSSGDPCDSPAAVDQRSCLNQAIVQNDAELNRTYQDLIAQSRKSGGSELEERFRQSQREWVNQRDAGCRGSGEGALWARARARCLADYSEKRTAELRRNLNSLRGQ